MQTAGKKLLVVWYACTKCTNARIELSLCLQQNTIRLVYIFIICLLAWNPCLHACMGCGMMLGFYEYNMLSWRMWRNRLINFPFNFLNRYIDFYDLVKISINFHFNIRFLFWFDLNVILEKYFIRTNIFWFHSFFDLPIKLNFIYFWFLNHYCNFF